KPINDFLCCSSVIGSLNILDIPWCASYTAMLAYRIAGVPIPLEWSFIQDEENRRFHFEYPGSTHAFRLDSDSDWHVTGVISNTEELSASGNRSLKIMYDRIRAGYG